MSTTGRSGRRSRGRLWGAMAWNDEGIWRYNDHHPSSTGYIPTAESGRLAGLED